MLNSVDFSGRPFHFLGVGGIGMSALAYVLADRKLPVSGSDLRLTSITERLQAKGVHVFLEQSAANLKHFNQGADGKNQLLPQVICSTAIHPDNPEYKAAVASGCPIFHRSDVLAGLIAQYKTIAVAGTHGKTTTSSLIAHMLAEGGLDPTVIVGGVVQTWGSNARVGQGPYLVAEADESDGSLVKFQSAIAIVTNIELDHIDHYSGLDQVVETFQKFAEGSEIVIGCLDCPIVQAQIQPGVTYSLDPDLGADYSVDAVDYGGHETRAVVWERGSRLGTLSLELLGSHNLSNALAAVAVGRQLGMDFGAIAAGIATFGGAKRRFEFRGEAGGVRFIDDYAHHPSELQVTLEAAKRQATGDNRRLVAVFQPHRFSRTLQFLPEFAQSFVNADLVVISDIYSAGEANPGGITGQTLARSIAEHHPNVHYQATLPQVRAFLSETLASGDLAIFLGAGNLNQVIPDLIADRGG
jgi:UDP-N-acetylmuramate--alanine ligase